VGFEPKTTAFEWTKKVYALDRVAPVIGSFRKAELNISGSEVPKAVLNSSFSIAPLEIKGIKELKFL
jgi:hypothetical protein